jgi:hypothetical protein
MIASLGAGFCSSSASSRYLSLVAFRVRLLGGGLAGRERMVAGLRAPNAERSNRPDLRLIALATLGRGPARDPNQATER